ncbi:hypothetical protein PHYSODRAFT_517562 [Phytophthora sojae]|uniref:Uncharacterized protein n=1 Tax=Phytophthora sojae (strain P6497) TaxID=1094619 RepID=G4ZVL3_PHYSP|nr:hypothetical protein PHYSODRAFT_517562 [Phytophthora sojae]EGZ12252.1 hypothetical protein PHYSODRAFT_517562 [Phytophthora sojae]|eukprot:XP_009532585.1 hypothetical protein PHYSODRAFT_517562 [Phytophthora sojae]
MELHGETEFNVYANPVVSKDGEKVLYDGYATFVEGHSRFTYSLVDGAAYLETNDSSSNAASVRCIPPSTLPFGKILPALNHATPIPSASIGDEPVECESGNLFKTTFAGVHYAICSTGEDGFTALASDLSIDVEYLDEPVSISKPTLSDGSSCKTSHMAMAASSCACNSTPRPCIFFHGLGNEKEEPKLQDSIRHFGWDKLQGHTPCCTVVKYASLNTVDYAWTNSSLQEKVCTHSLSMSDKSDKSSKTIEDTIVVTHSMGGLMLAGALANKECKLGKSATWIALSPPMTGSMSSDYLMDFCNGEVRNLMTDLLFNGRCPTSTAQQSCAYETEKYSDEKLDAAYDAAQEAYRKHVFAAMCSSSYVGNISKYQAKYMVGGRVIPHKSSKNDGLVEFHSCAGGLSPKQFGRTHWDQFYQCELNHADTAFKTGDGIFKDTVRPIKWFECLL